MHDPHCIISDSKCYVRCVKCGTFGWHCVQEVVSIKENKG